ncbi:hypothetical protein [Klebsiella pneumoniae ISC21]|nr:hypothetical protein [Klebsiella pneumoniae ISC21]
MSLLATPIDFASGKKYTVLEAVVKPETKTTPDAMIFNVFNKNCHSGYLLSFALHRGQSIHSVSLVYEKH